MSEPANQVANTENAQTELDENPTAATVEWKATDARRASKVSVMPNDSLAPSDKNRSSSQCLLQQCKDLHLVSSSDSECKMSTAAVLALDPQHGSCIPDKIDVGIVAPPNSPMCSEPSPQTKLYSSFLIESLNKVKSFLTEFAVHDPLQGANMEVQQRSIVSPTRHACRVSHILHLSPREALHSVQGTKKVWFGLRWWIVNRGSNMKSLPISTKRIAQVSMLSRQHQQKSCPSHPCRNLALKTRRCPLPCRYIR